MSTVAAYWALTKPGITRLVLLTTAVGFWLGARGHPGEALGSLLATLAGTALVAGGTNALNEWWERDADARMQRTRRRPLPAARLEPGAALLFAIAISVVGIVWLTVLVNGLTGFLAGLSLASYVFLYTPLKRYTPLALFVGAVPGALPILGGWTAAGRGLTAPGWALFSILFLWQIPHFIALGWLYREDYRRGGFATVGRDDAAGRLTAAQATIFAVLLCVVSLAPARLGLANPYYAAAATALGIVLVGWSVALLRAPSPRRARQLFLMTIAYLPVLLLLLVLLPR